MPNLLSFNNAYEAGRGLTTTVETNGSAATVINEAGLYSDSVDDQCLIWSQGQSYDTHSIEITFNKRIVSVISLLNSGWREIIDDSVRQLGHLNISRVRLYNNLGSVVFDSNTDDFYVTRKINYDKYGWAFADETIIIDSVSCDAALIEFTYDGNPVATGEYGRIGKVWLANSIPIDVGYTDKLTIKYDDKSVKVESDGGQLFGTKKQVLKNARFVMPAASYEDVFGDGNSDGSKFNLIFETNGTVAPFYFIMYKGDKVGGATELTTLQMYSSLENMPVLRTIGSRSDDNMPDWAIEFNLRERR